MDHLSGADDHSEKNYRIMRRRELGWLRSLPKSRLGRKDGRAGQA
jgi:hypothetical protein